MMEFATEDSEYTEGEQVGRGWTRIMLISVLVDLRPSVLICGSSPDLN